MMEKIFEKILQNPKLTAEKKAILERLSLPTTKDENWKYTRLQALSQQVFDTEKNTDFDFEKSVFETPYSIVFLNGVFSAAHSHLPEGCVLEGNWDLNMSNQLSVFFESTRSILGDEIRYFSFEKQIDEPILFRFIQKGEGVWVQPQIKIRIQKNLNLTLLQEFISTENTRSLTIPFQNIHLEANSHLHFLCLQNENLESFHFHHLFVKQEKDSFFNFHNLLMGGKIARNNLHILAKDQNTQTDLTGIFLGKKEQILDNHIFLEHAFSHQNSNQLYKGILDEKARGVFNGRIKIYPDAQKIQGFQSNKNILLSPTAQIDTKPELEIEANDVKCSHGTTTGELDEKALFYLQARGLSKTQAQRLLLQGFVLDALAPIKNETIKEQISQKINAFFEA